MKKVVVSAVFGLIAGIAQAAPETYLIDPSHSAVRFGYDHLGITHQQHRFDQMSGRIVFDRAAKTGSVDVTIDAKSLNTGSVTLNSVLQESNFFNTFKHPTIRYKSTSVNFDGDKPVSVDGELTIKGIIKPVRLTLTSFFNGPHPMLGRDAIGANAVATIKRSEFDMTKLVPQVADDVALSFTVQALKD